MKLVKTKAKRLSVPSRPAGARGLKQKPKAECSPMD